MNLDQNDNNNEFYNNEESPLPDSYILPEEGEESIPVAPEVESRHKSEEHEGGAPDSYILPEDEEDDDIDFPEKDDDGDDDGQPEEGGKNPLMMMFRTLMTPIEGWKEIRRSKISPEAFASGCFYPLIALASASEFIRLAYGEYISVSAVLVKALVVFLALFLGYFGTLVAGRLILPAGAKVLDDNFGKIFIMNAISSLALFYTLMTALPMLEPVLVFLPLWTIYIVYRGTRFLRFPERKQTSSTSILCFLIIGMPVLIGWLFTETLPGAS